MKRIDGVRARLRLARKNKGLSQQEAADAVHRSMRTVHTHETGKSPPTVEDLFAYADAYGVSPQWLVSGSDDPPPGSVDDLRIGSEEVSPQGMTAVDFRAVLTILNAHKWEDAIPWLDLVGGQLICSEYSLPLHQGVRALPPEDAALVRSRIQAKLRELTRGKKWRT